MIDPTTVFDGHNDVLLKLSRRGGPAAAGLFVTGLDGQIDLPKAQTGGLGGGFFAIFVPSPMDLDADMALMRQAAYDLALPDPIPVAEALPVALTQAATLLRLQELGALKICRTTAELHACLADGPLAAIMHMEGADAIDPDFHNLEVLHAAGLRSLGPVWSRPTLYGHGVPFRYPSDGDTGPGLTEAGTALVKRCNELGILVDLSHLNEAGFWDVAKTSTAPLVATHSNAHAMCPHARNLTDRQLDAIRDSDGLAGLNFATAFLRQDGRMLDDVPLTRMVEHLDYMLERLGETRVGFGSDFDGAQMPRELGDAAGLPKLIQAMRDRGYDDALIARICHGNWLRVLEATWTD